MSVHKRVNKNSVTYQTVWREGGKKKHRNFSRRGDALAFDIDIKRRMQLGGLASSVMQSKQTLAEFVEQEWWPRHAVPNLAEDTRRRYLEIWGKHLLPRIGDYELRAITPMLVEDLREQMNHANVGLPSQRKAMMLLQGILRRAAVRGLIPANPVKDVAKPKQAQTRVPSPLSPATVERIRSRLKPRDAMIVSLLAYAGLRPDEMMHAIWDDVTGRVLHVQANKTGRARDIDLLTPLAQDLREWRMLSGNPDRGLIVPTTMGGAWNRELWGNWRTRTWLPAAKAAGVTDDMRPYRCRGSYASLLLWEGRSLAYVASQDGHSIATLAKHYAGVLTELEHGPRVSAEQAIREARDQTKQRRAM